MDISQKRSGRHSQVVVPAPPPEAAEKAHKWAAPRWALGTMVTTLAAALVGATVAYGKLDTREDRQRALREHVAESAHPDIIRRLNEADVWHAKIDMSIDYQNQAVNLLLDKQRIPHPIPRAAAFHPPSPLASYPTSIGAAP
jgi:hypothetical protein